MSRKDKRFTILHIENDAVLAELVRTAFKILGFRGEIVTAGRMSEAVDLLARKERNHEPVNLILVDMQLPDGSGLDIIRRIKSDPAWHIIPIVVLSSESAPGVVNAAYALGANCFLSKDPQGKDAFKSLHTLYATWIESALLPQDDRIDLLQNAVRRAIRLRARTAEFYLSLARSFEGKPEMVFWLDRSLVEGNLANLLAFLQPGLKEGDLPAATIERLNSMQVQVQDGLDSAQKHLQENPSPTPEDACRWVLEMIHAVDEKVVAEVLGSLFPKGPEATTALKARAAIQLKELAHHISEKTKAPEFRLQAERLREWAEQFAAQPNPQQEREE